MSKREMHPNSLRAIREATEKRSKPTGKRVNVFLTEEAIAALDATATQQDISRSELVEQYARGKQAKLANELLCKLETIPRSPEKWDAKTKSEIFYGLEEAIKMALDLIEIMPCERENTLVSTSPNPEPVKKKGRSLHDLRKLMGTEEPAQTRRSKK